MSFSQQRIVQMADSQALFMQLAPEMNMSGPLLPLLNE